MNTPILYKSGQRPPADAVTHIGVEDQARAVIFRRLEATFGIVKLAMFLNDPDNLDIINSAVEAEIRENKGRYYVG